MRSNTTARIARRRSFRVAAAVLTAAAALTLTACNNDTGAAGTGGSSGSSGSSGGAQGSDAKGKGGEQAAAEGGGRAHAGVERCRTENLEAAFATGEDALPDRDGDGGATTASIVLINKSTSSCRIGGFPGVDLTSINGGERWSLARSSQKWSSLELEGGQSTSFTLNLAFTKEEEGFYQPAWVEITPPNETKSLKIEWPWENDSLVDQRGATRPATFVNPIG
ncbi:DUF4232 domain-containing protein [Streptomyces sp. NPDC059590]|uniref:DUF4232 domain-containing protein n=1 Tax=Streptomyces sp. NPDC059590 TaxID=3346877 RepID=UPI0036AEF69E